MNSADVGRIVSSYITKLNTSSTPADNEACKRFKLSADKLKAGITRGTPMRKGF